MAGTGATASQAWAILKRHARDEISPLRLQELCRDNDRVSSLVSVYNATPDRMLLVDLSRQRMTLETLNHLLRLATARDVKKFITRLAWGGQNDPDNPIVPARLRKTQPLHHTNKTTRFVEEGEQEQEQGQRQQRRRRNNVVSPERTSPANNIISIPSFHLALRAPAGQGLEMLTAPDGNNVLHEIHRDWDRIQRISELMRRGQLPGVTGHMIKDVVVIGRGVPMMALRFVYLALCKDGAANIGRRSSGGKHFKSQRTIKFLTSVDPVRAAAVVADLDPGATLVISLALNGNEETAMATRTMKSWLLQSLGNGGRRAEVILSKHMMLVTGNERIAAANKPESVFLIPEHSRCEPFTTFTAATLLPLSIVFGWPIVEQYIAGAHNMDGHFVETNPRHNLPVLLALTDVWSDSFFLGSNNGRIICPFTEAFAAYPAFCATLESQTCGGKGVVVDGGLHHAYDRALYQSSTTTTNNNNNNNNDRVVLPSELVMTMDSQMASNVAPLFHGMDDDVHATQDALICSMFAHADELAFGSSSSSSTHDVVHNNKTGGPLLSNTTTATTTTTTSSGSEVSDGNRPSTLLICGKCDAFTCGQLVALAEHRAVVKARIWDIDPFAKEIGSSLRSKRTERLKEQLQTMFTNNAEEEEDEDDLLVQQQQGDGMNLSTKTILRHYANMTRDQRVYVVKS